MKEQSKEFFDDRRGINVLHESIQIQCKCNARLLSTRLLALYFSRPVQGQPASSGGNVPAS